MRRAILEPIIDDLFAGFQVGGGADDPAVQRFLLQKRAEKFSKYVHWVACMAMEVLDGPIRFDVAEGLRQCFSRYRGGNRV